MTAAKTRSMKYGGYHRRRDAKADSELTRVGRGTPGGEYLRRFWHPIALASELGELPRAIRILGEDMVVFRDGGGRVGLLERRCSHRNTSLEYGLIQERGLRCCYHGWHYDVDGTILETPGEPPESRIKDKLCHGAYPVHEYAGLVFAYMGPPEERPEFPVYDSWVYPDGNKLIPYKLHNPFHWLQAHENGADPIHTCFLHARGSEIQFSEPYQALPELEFFETPLGVLSVATRRWNDYLWIRASDVILPNAAQFGGASIVEDEKFALCAWLTRWIVPIDDTSAYAIGLRHFNEVIDPEGEADENNIGLNKADFPGQVAAPTHKEGQRNAAKQFEVVLIGHRGHPEVAGTMGRVRGRVHLVTCVEDVAALEPADPVKLAYLTQTTLSVDDTRDIIAALSRRFPDIVGPDMRDICYATQNRQTAARALASAVDVVLVVGAHNSSNSSRLCEIAEASGVRAYLIEDAAALDPGWLAGAEAVGITAGASAPEELVSELVERLGTLYHIDIEVLPGVEENVRFRLPAELDADETPRQSLAG